VVVVAVAAAAVVMNNCEFSCSYPEIFIAFYHVFSRLTKPKIRLSVLGILQIF
jgi:hypothetical protein